jgi:hypothetical protein
MDRSQDRKAMAAGENREEYETEQEQRLAYAEEVLTTLLQFSNPPPDYKLWDEEEKVAWRVANIKRLSGVPLWKLQSLGDFTSPWITEVWQFFDNLKSRPTSTYEPPKQLTGPQINTASKIAKDCKELIDKLYSIEFKPTRMHENFPEFYAKERGEWVNKKRVVEKQELEKLHQKYPRAGFDKVITIRGL